MRDFPNLADVITSTSSKIVLFVIDGLGGLPHRDTGLSELETANIPNLDALANRSVCGVLDPVSPGITPGSGPGHLALFGYDPVADLVGRGVLETLGVGVELKPGDVAARGNFCTVDSNGVITDRRAGRIPTSESRELCDILDSIELPGVDLTVNAVRDHRFAVVFRGEGLSENVTETDPQKLGERTLPSRPVDSSGRLTADLVNRFIGEARDRLGSRGYANMITLRGFSCLPRLKTMNELYKLKPAAVASYAMYRGLARLVGMEVLDTGPNPGDAIDTVVERFDDYDFFFVHYKAADSAGEDGDFAGKVSALENVDGIIPRLAELEADVIAITGDHSTPAVLVGHSWHPVPLLIYTKGQAGDWVETFSERNCAQGLVGRMSANQLMVLLLANAMKLKKFGA